MTENVSDNLEELIKNTLPNLLTGAMENACLLVEGEAKKNAPVDDGQLRQSITHEVVNDNGNIAGYVGTNCEYAPYNEKGTGLYNVDGQGRKEVPWKYQDEEGNWHTTKGMKAHPFLEPAVTDNKSNIIKQFEGLL